MKAKNILWDTDDDKELLESLPTELEIPENVCKEEVDDYISEVTGYCHFGYNLEL